MEMEQLGQVEVKQGYLTARSFDVMEKAAQNEGGAAGGMLAAGLGLGMGLGAGVPAGQQIGKALKPQASQQSQNQQEAGTQENTANDSMGKLQKLKEMLDSDLISKEDYDETKKDILKNM